MADTGYGIEDLNELGSGQLASGDWFVAVDTSDTTDSDEGTTKKVDADNIGDALLSAFVKTVIDDANAAAVMTTLGITGFMQGMVDDTNLSDWLTTMGLDADLATLALPANLTISAFIKTILDDADADAARTTAAMVRTWVYEAQMATTSGTTVVLGTGLPAGILEIDIMFHKVSAAGNFEVPVVQLGDAGGYDVAGYEGVSWYQQGANVLEANVGDGFYGIGTAVFGASDQLIGLMRLRRWDVAEYIWNAYCVSMDTSSGFVGGYQGVHTMTGELTDIRINTPGAVVEFDVGEARMRYKT